MNKLFFIKKFLLFFGAFIIFFAGILGVKMDAQAADIPTISLAFDSSDQSVIVSGIPAYDPTGTVQFELNGYLNYQDERVETFCYAPSVYPHHIPEAQAYIFNWADIEFILPCSGEYQFTAYVKAHYFAADGTAVTETGPKQTITITLTKEDESTNWGPGLPNTTVETYDLEQIQGKDKNITIEEDGYTWTINGKDIETIPEQNLSLAITKNPDTLDEQSVSVFFGNTVASKFSIEYSGDFGFISILDYYLGPEYAGKHANLFYVRSDGSFEFMEGVLVDEAGFASYHFSHASDYVIAVTDVEYTGQELNPKPMEPIVEPENPETEDTSSATATEAETETPEADAKDTSKEPSQATGNGGKTESIFINPLFYVAIVMVLAVIGFVVFIVIKKKKK